MELSSYIVWNVVLTLVVAPVLYAIRSNSAELKRLDILINKTREEMAKEYISRDTFEYDMGKLMKVLEKLEQKIDRLFEESK
jgi:hypothetical protein|tara:strand:+ start:528 stop:773 length:246 start_codon:yes stop_codon:yes gene_type:complete